MKVLFRRNNNSLIVGNTLIGISPFTRQLDSGFIRFCPTIHKESFLVLKKSADIFFCNSQLVVVKRSRSKGEFLRLINECVDDPWMTMTLVDRAVGRKKIVV